MEINEPEILEGIKNCDSRVLEFVYQNYFQSIKHFVTSNNGTMDDAKDVFQDALTVIFEKIRNNNLKLNVRFSTYLFSVSKNIWLRELKRNKKQKNWEKRC